MFNVFFLLICITRFHAKGYICCCEVHPLPAVLGVKSIGYKSPPTWHERGASTVKNIIQRYTQNSYTKYIQVKVPWNSKSIAHMIFHKFSDFLFFVQIEIDLLQISRNIIEKKFLINWNQINQQIAYYRKSKGIIL